MAERCEECPGMCASLVDCVGQPVVGSQGYTELARLRSAADPERDARRDAYRERERRRAARALDRYIDLMWVPERAAGDPAAEQAAMFAAGERFVEAVGDYVLSRLGEQRCWQHGDDCPGSSAHTGCDVQQKSHYGASDEVPE